MSASLAAFPAGDADTFVHPYDLTVSRCVSGCAWNSSALRRRRAKNGKRGGARMIECDARSSMSVVVASF